MLRYLFLLFRAKRKPPNVPCTITETCERNLVAVGRKTVGPTTTRGESQLNRLATRTRNDRQMIVITTCHLEHNVFTVRRPACKPHRLSIKCQRFRLSTFNRYYPKIRGPTLLRIEYNLLSVRRKSRKSHILAHVEKSSFATTLKTNGPHCTTTLSTRKKR